MQITYELIKSLKPCYRPEDIGITEGYTANIPEFINKYRHKVKNKDDIIWILCHDEFMTDRELRLFAVWCARRVQHLIVNKKCIHIIDVAERYAKGLATYEELVSAKESAYAEFGVFSRLFEYPTPGSPYIDYAIESAIASAISTPRIAAWDSAMYSAKASWYNDMDIQVDKLLEIFIEKEKK